MKVVNDGAGTIDYRLNLLGIRVTRDSAQLVAKWNENDWTTIGRLRELPVRIPMTPRELESAAGDPLRFHESLLLSTGIVSVLLWILPSGVGQGRAERARRAWP
jgi:hypothetical protein